MNVCFESVIKLREIQRYKIMKFTQNNYESLLQEIKEFNDMCQLDTSENKIILEAFQNFEKMFSKKIKFSIFGSFAVDMFTWKSDLDLQLSSIHSLGKIQQEMKFNNCVTNLIPARVPLLRMFPQGRNKNKNNNDFGIDIVTKDAKTYTNFVIQVLKNFPVLKTVFFYLKNILQLIDYYGNASISSTALFHMICHFFLFGYINNDSSLGVNSNFLNNGEAFLKGFLEYITCFPFDTHAMKIDGIFDRRKRFSNELSTMVVVDYFEISNNVTKNTIYLDFMSVMTKIKCIVNLKQTNYFSACVGGKCHPEGNFNFMYTENRSKEMYNFTHAENRTEEMDNKIEIIFMIEDINKLSFKSKEKNMTTISQTQVSTLKINHMFQATSQGTNIFPNLTSVLIQTNPDNSSKCQIEASTETADFFENKAKLPYELENLMSMLEHFNPTGKKRKYLPKDTDPTKCFNCDDRRHVWIHCEITCKYCLFKGGEDHKGECGELKKWVRVQKAILKEKCRDDVTKFILEQYRFSYDVMVHDPKYWVGIEFYLVRLNIEDKSPRYYQGLRETRSLYPEGTEKLKRIGFEYDSDEMKNLLVAMPSIGYLELEDYINSL